MTGLTKEAVETVAKECDKSTSWVRKRLEDGWVFHEFAPDQWHWIPPNN